LRVRDQAAEATPHTRLLSLRHLAAHGPTISVANPAATGRFAHVHRIRLAPH
jgi:hypothetical protein